MPIWLKLEESLYYYFLLFPKTEFYGKVWFSLSVIQQ